MLVEVVEAARAGLMLLVMWLVCDGASKMRSDEPGIFGPALDKIKNGVLGGKSMLKRMQVKCVDERGRKCGCLHCASHYLNLALGDAVKNNLPKRFIKFVRMVCSWTGKSTKRKKEYESQWGQWVEKMTKLKEALEKAGTRSDGEKFRLLELAKYCATRWLGLLKACVSILSGRPALEGVVKSMREKGLTTTSDQKDAGQAGVDSADESDGAGSSDSDGGGASSDGELSPNGEQPAANKKKRPPMLHRQHGVTPANFGRCAYVNDVLRGYEVPAKLSQTHDRPTSHLVGPSIRQFMPQLSGKFSGPDPGGAVYLDWKEKLTSSFSALDAARRAECAALIARLDAEALVFANGVCAATRLRSGPYMPTYRVMELMNPFCPSSTYQNADMLQQLPAICKIWGVGHILVRTQMAEVRAFLDEKCSDTGRAAAGGNLVEFYNRSIVRCPVFWPSKAVALDPPAFGFSAAVSSAFVEHLFSIMAAGTSDRKTNIGMARFTNALHIRSARPPGPGHSGVAAGAGVFQPRIWGAGRAVAVAPPSPG